MRSVWAWVTVLMIMAAGASFTGCAETQDFPDGAVATDKGQSVDQAEPDVVPYLDGIIKGDTACAYYSTEAKHKPVAMMIVLDRSSSMTTNSKWTAAQQAIIKTIDKAAFDNMSLGLLVYPAFSIAAPPCLIFIPQVSCGVSALSQVPLSDTGINKSTAASGPRKEIYSWLANHGPDNTLTDASPGYDALDSAIKALQAYTWNGKQAGRRAVLFITDGGFSCTSVSKPTRPGYSDGLCPDWEHPDTVIQRLKAAHNSLTAPVSTFVIGVPGSDSIGQQQGPYATAPYHMRLALSAYANAGSPNTVPSSCTGKSFTKTGSDPAVPCHFDMTKGTFDANALAKIFDQVRGEVLGCVYELPKIDDKNKVIDKNKVNVRVTINSGGAKTLPKRSNPSDTCSASACWDYDKDGNVELLGKACQDLKDATTAKVEIIVGCLTMLK
jgi:hypothetical protein